jgi:hypothetical protein
MVLWHRVGCLTLETYMMIMIAEWLFLAALFAPPLVVAVSFVAVLVSGRTMLHRQIILTPAK